MRRCRNLWVSKVKRKLNLLFTSAGRRVELLRLFREAFRELNVEGRILATDISRLAPSLSVTDKYFLTPRFDHPDYVPELEKICRGEKIDLVIPLIDPDILILAQNKERLESTGARLAVVDAPAAEITRDKWLTYQFFLDAGVPVPASWTRLELKNLQFPLFVKPRSGSASHHTFKINNWEEATFFSNFITDPIFQEFLPGPEITTDVVTSLDGELLGLVSRQRIEVRGGEVSKGITVRNEEILDWCRKIAELLPAKGPITIQCLMKEGKPYFTEINARFGGGLPLGVAAGMNAPLVLLKSILGDYGKPDPATSYEVGLYITRCDQSFFLREI
jgi:carbamoyl-phosphate synthase large subunit